jgi:hypothetical protein
MLARIGLSAVPAAEAIKCDDFRDYLRFMYCLNQHSPIKSTIFPSHR